MKITFLGSSHGVPEANRRCSCALIEVSGRYYFIDMGMMAIDDLRTKGISIDDVKGIFITHMHGDHINGLIDFVDLITWYFKTADPVIFLPDLHGAKLITDWISYLHTPKRDLHYEEIKEGLIFDDGFLKVTAIGTQHISKSYAFLLEADGKHVLFTGDLKHPTVDFPKLPHDLDLDLLVCEGAHFPATEYTPVLMEYSIKKICVNHHAPRHNFSISQFTQDMKEMAPVITANDGMEIVL